MEETMNNTTDEIEPVAELVVNAMLKVHRAWGSAYWRRRREMKAETLGTVSRSDGCVHRVLPEMPVAGAQSCRCSIHPTSENCSGLQQMAVFGTDPLPSRRASQSTTTDERPLPPSVIVAAIRQCVRNSACAVFLLPLYYIMR
jgi:hypothetical protein